MSHFGLKGQFHRVRWMSLGGSSAALPFTPWKPLKFLVEEAVQEEQDEWETTMERLEVKDVEF